MAPGFPEHTTTGWETNSTQYTTSGWDNTNYVVTITTREDDVKIKKLLKKMKDEMCKMGWLYYSPNYSQPKLQPISLRGVRLDGRGWANL